MKKRLYCPNCNKVYVVAGNGICSDCSVELVPLEESREYQDDQGFSHRPS